MNCLTENEVIAFAIDWIRTYGRKFGALRYARYMWDFRSGLGFEGDRLARHFVYFPTPHGRYIQLPEYFEFKQGWLVVFNPQEREAENPDECALLWIDDSSNSVREKVPSQNRSRVE